MITVAEARVAAATRLRSRAGDWAGQLVSHGTAEDGLVLGLKPPTEAQVLADRGAAQAWVQEWREADGVHGCAVDWEARAWSRVGRQTVPVRLRIEDPAALARFAGGDTAAQWRRLAQRARQLRERFAVGGGDGSGGRDGLGERDGPGERGLGLGLAHVLRRHRAAIAGLDEAGFAQVCEAAAWLAAHPGGGRRTAGAGADPVGSRAGPIGGRDRGAAPLNGVRRRERVGSGRSGLVWTGQASTPTRSASGSGPSEVRPSARRAQKSAPWMPSGRGSNSGSSPAFFCRS